MSNQPRVDTYEPAAFFADGQSVRGPVAGTIARGQLREDSAVETGREAGEQVDRIPIDVTAALMRRGQERYGIFCAHCHGPAGYGDGMVVQRGFPAPPSYHIGRLQQAPAGHLFGVVTNGHGRMPPFGRRIDPSDRWAIIAYVRALQLSQSAPLRELPAFDRAALSDANTM
jgi:mono/diheme cytochrome c family protein